MNAYLDSRGQTTKNQVRNLGVILETDLSFSSHVKAVTKSAYYHLKIIARIRCFVSSQDLEKLVHAFITSRVDYCNGLLTGLPKKNFILKFLVLLFLTPCFYCCEWLFHFLLCKALWITTVYEMCYINKLALPCLALPWTLKPWSLIYLIYFTFIRPIFSPNLIQRVHHLLCPILKFNQYF